MLSIEKVKREMRRTPEDAQKTKDTILDAAVSLFATKGVHNTSLEEIARKANVTRGAIYWHFQNKAEIFNALHERLYQPLAEIILQDLSDKSTINPLHQLENLCIKLLLDLENNEKKRQATEMFMIKCNYTGNLAQYREPHLARKEESLKLFVKYFEKAKKANKLPETADPNLLTLSIRCYMKGIIVEYLNNPENFSLTENAEKLIKQFFKQF